MARANAAAQRYAEAHPDRVRAQKAAWEKTPKARESARRRSTTNGATAKRRFSRLHAVLGVSPEMIAEMLEAQGGVCAICRQPERRAKRNGEPFALCLDHSHADGRPRALLCSGCNHMIGVLESPMLGALQAYLAEWSS